MTYLLDTSILSELTKPSPNPETVRAFTEHFDHVRLASVSLHEIRYGIERLLHGKRKETLREAMRSIVSDIAVLPYGEAAAEWHATERARLEKEGKTPSFADGQIAAIAAVNGCELITVNVKDFRGFDLKVETWS